MSIFFDEHDRIANRIASAPVEPWLKMEALDDLGRLRAEHDRQITQIHERYHQGWDIPAPADDGFPEDLTEPEKFTEIDLKSEKSIAQAPVDKSWQRMQIIDFLTRGERRLSGSELIEQAKAVEAWLDS